MSRIPVWVRPQTFDSRDRDLSLGGSIPFCSRALDAGHVDGRTGTQWLKSAIAYCEWRSGAAWRSLGNASQRNEPERWYYIHGIKALTDILYSEPEKKTLHVPLPVLNPSPTKTTQEIELAQHSRVWLVDEIFRVAPGRYTDRKLLARLPKPKLARILTEATAAAEAAEPERMRA